MFGCKTISALLVELEEENKLIIQSSYTLDQFEIEKCYAVDGKVILEIKRKI